MEFQYFFRLWPKGERFHLATGDFILRPNGTVELFVYLGNVSARHPQYDIEKISQYVDAASLNRVGAYTPEKNPMFVAVEPPKPPLTERSPYILPVGLGLVVAILGFLLLRVVSGAAKSL